MKQARFFDSPVAAKVINAFIKESAVSVYEIAQVRDLIVVYYDDGVILGKEGEKNEH